MFLNKRRKGKQPLPSPDDMWKRYLAYIRSLPPRSGIMRAWGGFGQNEPTGEESPVSEWPSETRYVETYVPPEEVTPPEPGWIQEWVAGYNPASIKTPTEEGFLPVLKSLITGATTIGTKYLETRAQEKRIKAGLPPISPYAIPKSPGILSSLGISTNTALLVGAGVLGVMLIKKKKSRGRVVYRRARTTRRKGR